VPIEIKSSTKTPKKASVRSNINGSLPLQLKPALIPAMMPWAAFNIIKNDEFLTFYYKIDKFTASS